MTKKTRATQKVTMTDVAKRAGVSQMTVSRVFSSKKNSVADRTVEKIHTIAKEMGYIHNSLASTLVSGDASRMVAVLIPTMENRVFNDVLNGINTCASEHGVSVVFGVTEYDMQIEEKVLADFLAWRPKGVVVTGLEHTQNTVSMITQNNFPVVEIMDIDTPPMHSAYGISHIKAGQMMAYHLLGQGYQHIAYIDNRFFQDYREQNRQTAFVDTLQHHGVGCEMFVQSVIAPHMLSGWHMTEQLLQNNSQIEAIFYGNDVLATGGMSFCIRKGIKMPDDLALAGFSNLSYLEAQPYRLTTIQTPRYDMGYQATRHLLNTPETKVIKDMGMELIIGETT